MLYVDDDDDGDEREQTNLILLLFHFGMLSVFGYAISSCSSSLT